MTVPARRLPDQFPIGTKYVVEGLGGGDGNLRVFSRFVLLPDGRRIDLPADFVRPEQRVRFRRRAMSSLKAATSAQSSRPRRKNRG
jgi:hypothetical protein